MIELDNQTDIPCEIAPLEAIAAHLSDREVELTLVDDEAMQTLNWQYRRIDRPTDVLSFPLEPVFGAPLGSIVISMETAKAQADRYGHTLQEEVTLLFLHGLLHLLGFDHECDEGQMARKEQYLRREWGLPEALSEREEG
jgi:probable rRNA maturation factor